MVSQLELVNGPNYIEMLCANMAHESAVSGYPRGIALELPVKTFDPRVCTLSSYVNAAFIVATAQQFLSQIAAP